MTKQEKIEILERAIRIFNAHAESPHSREEWSIAAGWEARRLLRRLQQIKQGRA